MPKKMFYSTLIAEILIVCRTTKRFDNFQVELAEFFVRMNIQGQGVRTLITKLLDRHFDTHFARNKY